MCHPDNTCKAQPNYVGSREGLVYRVINSARATGLHIILSSTAIQAGLDLIQATVQYTTAWLSYLIDDDHNNNDDNFFHVRELREMRLIEGRAATGGHTASIELRTVEVVAH